MKMTMGAVIAKGRKEKGMTQLELARQLGVTDKAVSKWERDLSCPDVQTLPKLAQVLGMTVEELLQAQPASPRNKEKPDLKTTVCSCVALAMGIAVTVLSLLKQLDVQEGFGLLGVGLTALSLCQFLKKENI